MHGPTADRYHYHAELVEWNQPQRTPDFEIPNGNTGAMPRDVLLTVGNEIVEATMSIRARFFEYRNYRSLLNEYFERDPNFRWHLDGVVDTSRVTLNNSLETAQIILH